MQTAKSRNDLYLSSLKQFGHKRGGEIYAAVKNTFSANRAKEAAQLTESAETAANPVNSEIAEIADTADKAESPAEETGANIDGDIKIQSDEE
jgi:hypothetical protein